MRDGLRGIEKSEPSYIFISLFHDGLALHPLLSEPLPAGKFVYKTLEKPTREQLKQTIAVIGVTKPDLVIIIKISGKKKHEVAYLFIREGGSAELRAPASSESLYREIDSIMREMARDVRRKRREDDLSFV